MVVLATDILDADAPAVICGIVETRCCIMRGCIMCGCIMRGCAIMRWDAKPPLLMLKPPPRPNIAAEAC